MTCSNAITKHLAPAADHIAHVQFLELFVVLLADAVPRHVGLDIPLQVLHIAERRLPHHTLGHHTPCDGYLFSFQFLKVVFDLLAVVCLLIFCDDKRVLPVLLQLRKFLAAHLSQLVQILLLSVFLLLCHCTFSFLITPYTRIQTS